MTTATAINVMACGILASAITGFWILLYREESIVRRWPMIGSLALRIPLIAVAAGALHSCLTSKEADWSEAATNCGLAGIFCWGVIFHKELIKSRNGSYTKHHQGGRFGGHRQGSGAD